MLPFMKSKEASSSEPVEHMIREPDEGSEYDPLESAAEDLISAVHSKNVKSVASALRAAFELCDSEPHEEGPHE
jgi:hypothetical protein